MESFLDARDHNTGIQVRDLASFEEFQLRPSREHSTEKQLRSLQAIGRVFATSPDQVLQTLVEVAADLCAADSAGVSLEARDEKGNPVFHWAALTGQYLPFLNAMLPRDWMPCGVCLDTMRPQHVRVPLAHFAAMGVEAAEITDGILIPWDVEGTRGTIWIIAHHNPDAFNTVDYQIMQTLADFATLAVRFQKQQSEILRQTKLLGSVETANHLAHKINNPLQSITNSIFLAEDQTRNEHAHRASEELKELSRVVAELLELPRKLNQTPERLRERGDLRAAQPNREDLLPETGSELESTKKPPRNSPAPDPDLQEPARSLRSV